MSKVYPSDLSRNQYEFLNDSIPEAKPGVVPVAWRCGQSSTPSSMFWSKAFNGVPYEREFPPWETVYT